MPDGQSVTSEPYYCAVAETSTAGRCTTNCVRFLHGGQHCGNERPAPKRPREFAVVINDALSELCDYPLSDGDNPVEVVAAFFEYLSENLQQGLTRDAVRRIRDAVDEEMADR